jgi:hypothetical protein
MRANEHGNGGSDGATALASSTANMAGTTRPFLSTVAFAPGLLAWTLNPLERTRRTTMADSPVCCWTHCDQPQGVGTWTEINGETLPVCEDHWYGNIDRERRRLTAEVEQRAVHAVLDRLVAALQDIEGIVRSHSTTPLGDAILDRLRELWAPATGEEA